MTLAPDAREDLWESGNTITIPAAGRYEIRATWRPSPASGETFVGFMRRTRPRAMQRAARRRRLAILRAASPPPAPHTSDYHRKTRRRNRR